MTAGSQRGKTMFFLVLRFGFRLIPITEAARDRIRQRFLDRYPHLVPTQPPGQIATPTFRRARRNTDELAIGQVAHRPEPANPSARPCVVVHAWYPDAFEEILTGLQTCGVPFRLIVTTAPEKTTQIRAILTHNQQEAEVEVYENRGRDILPFLHVAHRLVVEGEEVILKLHTKHSPHRQDGDRWRGELLDWLLAADRAPKIFQAFGRDSTLGMVAPDGHVQPLSFYWGSNEDNVRYLAARIGIAAPRSDSDTFVAGSMFWLRLSALRPLLDVHLDEWKFEPEAGQVDGTFAHAIERIFALCVRDQGMRVENSSAACGEPDPADPGDYPYARRG